MNMNRLINVAMRQIMNRGINKGIDFASKRGKSQENMTQGERQNAQNTRQTMQKARQGMRIMRRFMR